MSKAAIGKLERVDLREVWKHEVHDFTQWLQNNVAVLNDALNLNLRNVDRAHAAAADIWASPSLTESSRFIALQRFGVI